MLPTRGGDADGGTADPVTGGAVTHPPGSPRVNRKVVEHLLTAVAVADCGGLLVDADAREDDATEDAEEDRRLEAWDPLISRPDAESEDDAEDDNGGSDEDDVDADGAGGAGGADDAVAIADAVSVKGLPPLSFRARFPSTFPLLNMPANAPLAAFPAVAAILLLRVPAVESVGWSGARRLAAAFFPPFVLEDG